MFTSPLPSDEDYRVFFSNYAQRHNMKRFAKDYKGKRWDVTVDSIFQDLKRVYTLGSSQQVDELKHGNTYKLFKYDFAIAQSNISPKASGNRCIIFLDSEKRRQDVLFVYGKGDIPKNMSETQFIYAVVQENFKELWDKLD